MKDGIFTEFKCAIMSTSQAGRKAKDLSLSLPLSVETRFLHLGNSGNSNSLVGGFHHKSV